MRLIPRVQALDAFATARSGKYRLLAATERSRFFDSLFLDLIQRVEFTRLVQLFALLLLLRIQLVE